MNEINITTSLNLKELSVQLRHQVDNKDLSKFAVSLGEGRDGSFELELIKEASRIINTVYKSDTEDPEMVKLIGLLKEITRIIKNLEK